MAVNITDYPPPPPPKKKNPRKTMRGKCTQITIILILAGSHFVPV